MANEFIARKGFISLTNAQITGSLSVTGDVSASAFSGSFIGDGSQLSGIEGFPFTGSAGITGSLTVVGPVNATTFTGDGSQLTGIEGFPYTGSAGITGSLIVNGNVEATSFTGSLQGTSTSSSYVQLVDVDGFTAYSSSVNTAIGSVLDATTPLTATVNTTNTPFTLTTQSIVVADSTDGDITINLPDLDAIVGTSDQKPIVVYKNDYSQNVIYVQPSGSQLVNGASQDIIVSIQLAVIYNPTSAGWVTEGTSAQSLAELELFFVPKTETGSLSVATASYVEYSNVANKPALVSGSSQISFSGITGKPTLVSGSSQISFTGIVNKPTGIVSSSVQVKGYNVFATTGSNQFNGSQAITGSLTVTGQVIAQTLNVQQVTSSIVFSSGSNRFGNNSGNKHQFTGSLQVSGSSHNILGNVGIGPTGTPVSELQVGKSSDVTIAMSNSSSVTSGNRGSLAWYNSSNSTVANIKATAVTDNVGTQLEFYTRPAAGSLTQALTLSSTGNLGLGVTPSAWNTSFKALQVGVGASFWASNISSLPYAYMSSNQLYDAGNTSRYIMNGFATWYIQEEGTHKWLNAPSGTAGNAITFTQAMALTSGGNLYVGNTDFTSPNGADKFIGVYGGQDASLILQDAVQLWELYVNDDFYITSGATPRLTINRTTGAATFSSTNLTLQSSTEAEVRSLSTSTGNYANFIVDTDNSTNYRLQMVGFGTTASGTLAGISRAGNGFVVKGGGLLAIGTRDSHALVLSTNETERMRITSEGRVGIGQTAPGVALSVAGQSEPWQFAFTNVTGTVGAVIGSPSANVLAFGDWSGNERVRITSGGFLKASNTGTYINSGGSYHEINSDQTTYALYIKATNASPYGTIIDYSSLPNNTGNEYIYCTDNSFTTLRFSVRSNGGIANYQANDVNLSDERTKKDIEPLESYWDKFKNIEIVKFKYKDQTHDDYNIGVIAQQVESVAPEFVDVDGWGETVEGEEPLKSIYTADLHHATIKVLQECMSKIEEQQSQIESLKAEIQTLKQ
jgi:hypothetical protein